MDRVIEANNISKSFSIANERKVDVLTDINFVAYKGEMVGIVGRSGSGKSTLLYILSGLMTPTDGNVILQGNELSHLSDDDISLLRNKKIGFVFQNFFLEPSLSAIDNVALPLIASHVSKEERLRLARAALASVGMEEREEHIPSELSGGEQQRVCLARAMINAPSVIFADEPTGNLDAECGRQIVSLLRDYVSRGNTVIMVTHEEDDARKCDRVYRLLDGKAQDEKFI